MKVGASFTDVTVIVTVALFELLEASFAWYVNESLPVYVGMRNWHPYLTDTLRAMYAAGHRHAIGFIAAAHHSYSSCQQYRENVAAAREEIRRDGADIDVTYVGSWYDHPLFIAANVAALLARRHAHASHQKENPR